MIWNISNTARLDNSIYSPAEIEKITVITRLNLYNQNAPCGANAIRKELENLNIKPLPSVSSINRILKRHGLTHRRTGYY